MPSNSYKPIQTVANAAAREVDASSLIAVRIVFGAIGALSMSRIIWRGWVDDLYAGPTHRFRYPWFGWVPVAGIRVTTIIVLLVGLAGLSVSFGWNTRPALGAFLLGFIWLELIDVTTYLNHYWFMTLAGFVLLAVPLKRRSPIAVGWIWLLRCQVALVYGFAGLAKLSDDWLAHAMPLTLWLPVRSNMPVVGPLLNERWVAYAFSWGGAAFDCSIVVLLLWHRSRPLAWLAVVAFHVATWILFPIGVFPWLMIGMTTAFFEPDWPTRAVTRVRRALARPARRAAPARSDPTDPTVLSAPMASDGQSTATAIAPPSVHLRRLALAAVWLAIMVALPLRHHLIPGDARWTNEGYRLSWNVLVTEKAADVVFRLRDRATGAAWTRTASDLYTPLQWKAMAADPELIRQAAHLLAQIEGEAGRGVEVRVDAFVSFNGRPAQRLINPEVDLAREPYRPFGQPWILPAPHDAAP